MTKSVAILGCGPAGLMSAHAAALSGWDFRVYSRMYSRNAQSKLFGAQYLHAHIPELDCGEAALVEYRLNGTPEDYRRKVYGDDWDGTVSPEDFLESHNAWDLRLAYQHLWDKYVGEIKHFEVFGNSPAALAYQILGEHDLVISTVPRKIWAKPGDVFESTKVWALGDTEMPRVEPVYRPEPFSVICEASRRVSWYRVSNIYGYCTVEWPHDAGWYSNEPAGYVEYHDGYRDYAKKILNPPLYGASVVEKPLRHNSTAASDFVHLGRYGKWEKGVLTSDAFYDAMKVLANDQI